MSAYQSYSSAGQGYVQDPFGSQQYGGGAGVKKQQSHTLRPVTIKQLLNASQTQTDGDHRIDNIPLGQVTFIGSVRNLNKQSTSHLYQIEDGTGSIDVRRFPPEEEDPALTSSIKIGSYVRIVGILKDFSGRMSVSAHSVRAVENLNELTYHNLEVMYVHTSGGDTHMTSATNSYTATNYNTASSDRDTNASRILDLIRSHPNATQAGVHRNEILSKLAPSPAATQAMNALMDNMLQDGYLFNGVDDDHVMAMD
ncbi:replication factor A protein 2 [Podila humilis]|nr:replication factor A protein 2 [Podila humilis]